MTPTINARRFAAAFLMVGLFGAMLAPAAFAQDATDVTVTAGTLTMDAIAAGNFAGVTIGNAAQSPKATLANFNVRDFRGTGAGWNVTAQATQFAQWDSTLNAGAGGYVTGGKTLAASSLTLVAPTVAAVGDTTSPAPAITAGPYTVDGAGAVKFASATANTGMGEYTLAFGADSLTLAIPVNVVAATYRSTVTVDLVSGP